MFNGLDRFGLPIKYALLALFGGGVALAVAVVLGWQAGDNVVGTLIALAVGGYVGGMIRKRQGRTS
jgi:divalent metal cation (Fe/Co/Zn/Cd) transporter